MELHLVKLQASPMLSLFIFELSCEKLQNIRRDKTIRLMLHPRVMVFVTKPHRQEHEPFFLGLCDLFDMTIISFSFCCKFRRSGRRLLTPVHCYAQFLQFSLLFLFFLVADKRSTSSTWYSWFLLFAITLTNL